MIPKKKKWIEVEENGIATGEENVAERKILIEKVDLISGGISMNNVFKVLIAILAIILLLGAVVIIGGLAYLLPVESSSEIEQAVIWEESSQDTFVSELHSYEDSFEFVYIPVNPNTVLDCYVNYHFQENGNTQENVDRKLYENISVNNPVSLEFPRKKESAYKLEVTIEDKDGAALHRSEMEVHSSSEKMK